MPADLLRVRPDDPDYLRLAALEAAFWNAPPPFSLEANESISLPPGPVDLALNARFSGDTRVGWEEVVARHGPFQRGLVLGTSALTIEANLLATNPDLHATFLDISPGPLEKRRRVLGARFPGRVETQQADLNFVQLEPERFDLVVSCGTLHHVTNLEHLADQVRRTLTAEGRFFLNDYVGEPRYDFSPEKRRIFEIVHDRDLARQRGRRSGIRWHDASDLSPLCGVRSDETLGVLASFLEPVDVRTAGTLLVPLMRSAPVDADREIPMTSIQLLRGLVYMAWRRLQGKSVPVIPPAPELLHELTVVGDVLSAAGLLCPGIAFAAYRKRR